jgi:hypothetical protein
LTSLRKKLAKVAASPWFLTAAARDGLPKNENGMT